MFLWMEAPTPPAVKEVGTPSLGIWKFVWFSITQLSGGLYQFIEQFTDSK